MRKIMFCSGAGLSAESGVPTFRDSGGLWENHRVEDVCDYNTWLDNYILVNEFYNARRKQLATVEPNEAHKAIAELSKQYQVFNITTNVDDLLERAGCKDVVHLHGNLLEVVTKHGTEDSDIINVGHKEDTLFEQHDLYPVKPNVVFFSEMAPKYQILHNELTDMDNGDILVVIGSSEQVVDFCITARYICHFNGKIVFVNKDQDLTLERKMNHGVIPVNMSATNFFKQYDFEKLFEMDNPYLAGGY